MMTDLSSISRRGRQILEILYAHDKATVLEVQRQLPDAPSDMAIRRLLEHSGRKGTRGTPQTWPGEHLPAARVEATGGKECTEGRSQYVFRWRCGAGPWRCT